MIKVGIVGCGAWGAAHAQHYESVPQVDIAGFFDLDSSRAESMALEYGSDVYRDLDALLGDDSIQLVSICTPEFDHAEPFCKTIEAGKAAYLEKPLATSIPEGIQMRDAAKNGLATCGFLLRYQQQCVHLKEKMIHYGRLAHMYMRRRRSRDQKALYGRVHPARVMLSHDANLALWYAGVPFTRVVAMEGNFRNEETVDHITVMVEFENGATATLETDWMIPEGSEGANDDVVNVSLEKGTFDLRFPGDDYSIIASSGKQRPELDHEARIHGVHYGCLRVALEDMVRCVLRGEQPTVNTIDDALETAGLIEGAILSARENRPVTREEMLG